MRKKYLSIEITDHKIRYTYFEGGKAEFYIKAAGSMPFSSAGCVPGSLVKIIHNIQVKHDFIAKRLFVTINLAETLIRQIQMPRMSRAELEEAIPAQIEKIPPFYSKEYDYIYQRTRLNKEQDKVLFAAVSQEVINFILEETRAVKVSLKEIEIAPLNLPSVLGYLEQISLNEGIICVNEKHTCFGICREGRLEYIYKTATGVQDLFQGDDSLNPVVFKQWVAELQRVAKSVALDEPELNFSKIWLLWDRDASADLNKLLEKEFDSKIHAVDKQDFEGTKIKFEKNQEINPIALVSLPPLFQHIHKTKPQFSLKHFLKPFHHEQRMRKISFFMLAFTIFVSAVCGQSINYYDNKAAAVNKKTERIDLEISRLENESKELFEDHRKYQEVRDDLLVQATYVQILKKLSWADVMTAIADELPDELALTSFEVQESGVASFKGQAFKMESVAELMRKIDRSDLLVKGRFDYLREKIVNEKKVFDFGILANLNVSDKEKVEKDAIAKNK